MNDLGLVSVLPPAFLVALVLLAASFAVAISARRVDEKLLLAHLVLLIAILYGTLSVVEDVPRQLAVWRHMGVSDYVAHHGSVDRTIDAYFNWPGFFIMGAFWTQIAGISGLIEIARWTSPLSNLAYLLPLAVLYRSRLDSRDAWLALWIFYCCNWVAQDHWSPQGFGYLLYLTIVTALVTVLAARAPIARRSAAKGAESRMPRRLLATWQRVRASLGQDDLRRPWSISPVQRSCVLAVIVAIFLAMAISHQLTPYAAGFAAAGLILLGVTSARALPLTMAVFVLTWFTFAAVPYLKRFLHGEVQNLGEVTQNFSASVESRLGGSSQHVFVAEMRLVMTFFIGVLALAGALDRFNKGKRDGAFLVLMIAPVCLVGLQSYGGEILLRSYYFALPGLAFFVAALAAAVPHPRGSLRSPALVFLLSVVLLGGFVITRYGNERLDFFTRDEYQAVNYFYGHAPSGSIVWLGAENLPWSYERYRAFKKTQNEIVNLEGWQDASRQGVNGPKVVKELIRSTNEQRRDNHTPGAHAFVVITRSMAAQIDFFEPATAPGSLARVEDALSTSPDFRLVFRNRDAVIYELA
jgi:hypothetical protein